MTHEINDHIDLLFNSAPENSEQYETDKSISPDLFRDLNARFEESKPEEVLEWGFHHFGQDMVIGTGFGPSGVLLIHRIVTQYIPVTVFYLDTHLLYRETYRLRDELEERFGIEFERVSTHLSVDDQAEKYGDKLWEKNPDKCCYLRKVLPLQNYLADKKSWVTGVRRSQANTRKQTNILEWDPVNRVVKINPLAKWTNGEVWDYIQEHDLPYNPLHDHGYPTIGCIPCTESVDPGESVRSGRWKNNDKIECGIHIPTQQFRNGNK